MPENGERRVLQPEQKRIDLIKFLWKFSRLADLMSYALRKNAFFSESLPNFGQVKKSRKIYGRVWLCGSFKGRSVGVYGRQLLNDKLGLQYRRSWWRLSECT